MSLYAERRCKPCEGGIAPFSESQAREALASLAEGWALTKDGRELLRDYRFPNFLRTMSFVNAVAHVANAEDHHPDLELGYDYCRIRYTTHAIQGLCENDFICAAKIDRL
jgi:4a-hydroxytetrahydrobiopterin dehydratase